MHFKKSVLKNHLLYSIITLMAIAMLFPITAFAQAYSQAASYTAYALKLNKTNNFTSMHAKTTSDDYITNEVTAITNTSYANFWAVNNSKSKISNKYKQGVGTGSCNLIFTKSGYNSTNTQVGMGMENYQSQLSTAFVSGNVDFR